MLLSDFVERNLSSILLEVQQNELSDSLLDVYEIAIIYHYTDVGFEDVNEGLIQSKGKISSVYAKLLSEVLAKLPNYQDVVFRGVKLTKNKNQDILKLFAVLLLFKNLFSYQPASLN